MFSIVSDFTACLSGHHLQDTEFIPDKDGESFFIEDYDITRVKTETQPSITVIDLDVDVSLKSLNWSHYLSSFDMEAISISEPFFLFTLFGKTNHQAITFSKAVAFVNSWR